VATLKGLRAADRASRRPWVHLCPRLVQVGPVGVEGLDEPVGVHCVDSVGPDGADAVDDGLDVQHLDDRADRLPGEGAGRSAQREGPQVIHTGSY
jgi:hypothetical protein